MESIIEQFNLLDSKEQKKCLYALMDSWKAAGKGDKIKRVKKDPDAPKREMSPAVKAWNEFIYQTLAEMKESGWTNPETGKEPIFRDAMKLAGEKKKSGEWVNPVPKAAPKPKVKKTADPESESPKPEAESPKPKPKVVVVKKAAAPAPPKPEAESPKPKPKVVVVKKAAAPAPPKPEPKARNQDLEFTETVAIDDDVYIYNKRGDCIDENCKYIGNYDAETGTLDRSVEQPDDIEQYLQM
jgi:hypothetical protein